MADQDDVIPEVANLMARESYRFMPHKPDDVPWYARRSWRAVIYGLLAFPLLLIHSRFLLICVFAVVVGARIEHLSDQIKVLQQRLDLSQHGVSPADLPAVKALETNFQQSNPAPTGIEPKQPPANDSDAQNGLQG